MYLNWAQFLCEYVKIINTKLPKEVSTIPICQFSRDNPLIDYENLFAPSSLLSIAMLILCN